MEILFITSIIGIVIGVRDAEKERDTYLYSPFDKYHSGFIGLISGAFVGIMINVAFK